MSTRPGIKNLPRPSMVWAPGGAGVVAITTSPIVACSSEAISRSYQQTYPQECITSRSDDGDRRAGEDPRPFPDTCRGLDPGKADEELTAAARANAERLHPAAVELNEPPDEAQ